METFCLVYKTCGDFGLASLAIVVGACAVSKGMAKLVRHLEASLKASAMAMRITGLLLIAVAVLYIFISVRLQKKDAKERSPIYQYQILLKHRAENIETELIKLAARYDKGSFNEKNNIEVNEYGYYFEPKVEKLIK